MPISEKSIDQLLEGCSSPEDILGESGLLKQLTEKVAERALEAEMESHIGYSKTFISQVTNAVMEEVTAWQNRPLDTLYPGIGNRP
jgi:transposase-like protein